MTDATTKTWARIVDGAVAELVTLPIAMVPGKTVFHPTWFFVDVTATPDVALGSTWNGTVFAAPVDPPPSAADLAAYANQVQAAMVLAGYKTTIAGQTLTFATDPVSRADIMATFMRLQQANAPASVNWQFASGFVSIASADFIAVAVQIADAIQAVYDTLASTLAAINASPPTITTTAEVDRAFAALSA